MPAVEQLDFKGAILQNKTLLFNKLKQKLHEINSIYKGITKLLSLSITKRNKINLTNQVLMLLFVVMLARIANLQFF